MNGGRQSVTDFLRGLSTDTELQAARERFLAAVDDSHLDDEVKRAFREGDYDVVHRRLAREHAELSNFILYFC